MLPYPKFVQLVKQIFSLALRQTRLENLQLMLYVDLKTFQKIFPGFKIPFGSSSFLICFISS
jgi:hypothetical protein